MRNVLKMPTVKDVYTMSNFHQIVNIYIFTIISVTIILMRYHNATLS